MLDIKNMKNIMAESENLFLIDGSGFIFRAFHALPMMTRPDGTPVNAVFGFTNMLLKLLTEMKAHKVAVIFDAARKNFRNEIYADYKAHRPPPPEELVPQFALIKEATKAFNLPCLEMEGFEADDLIATYARLAKEQGQKVTIVSSDKDLMQLVDEDIHMFDPMKNKVIGVEQVQEKFGVEPSKVIDVQALAGDSSDNVPGVPGIGIKTAAELINVYGSLEVLLEKASEIKQPKRRENLINHRQDAEMSKKLVTLSQDTPVEMTIDQMDLKSFDADIVRAFLIAQNFHSILSRLEKANILTQSEVVPSRAPPVQHEKEYEVIDTVAKLEKWCALIREKGYVAVDTETDSLEAVTAKLVGVSFSIQPGVACYIPLQHIVEEKDLLSQAEESTHKDYAQIPLSQAIDLLKPILEDPAILKIGHNLKYDMQILFQHNITLAPLDDTLVISYLLEGGLHGHSLDELSKLYFDHDMIKFKDLVGTGKKQITFDYLPIEIAAEYAAEDADYCLRLYEIFKPRLRQENVLTLYEQIERKLVPVIANMERKGIKIDAIKLKDISVDFSKKIQKFEKDIYALAGHEFNIGSPKQLSTVLFEELGLESKKKGKSGQYSTHVDVLEPLALAGHEIVRKILDWRHLSKLKNTYTEALQKKINPKTGRVHTSYSLAGTNTGRLSSSDPNLQNIPIRTAEGREIRKAFIADEGYKLMSVDYSQIELRLAAAMADVKNLKAAFENGYDVHTHTAKQVFGLKDEEVTPDHRRQAKSVNFGILYGISAFGLSQQLGCDSKQAQKLIDAYYVQFPELKAYMEKMISFGQKHGYVESMFGRKCHLPTIRDKNYGLRQFAERQAVNAPFQSTQADIIKKAMVRIEKMLADEGLKTRMLLQVHDELIFEIPDAELETTPPKIKEIMENVVTLSVPLDVDIGIGMNWQEAH